MKTFYEFAKDRIDMSNGEIIIDSKQYCAIQADAISDLRQLKQRAEKAEELNNSFICGYCHVTFPKTDKGMECVAKHLKECEKNPFIQHIDYLSKLIAAKDEALEMLKEFFDFGEIRECTCNLHIETSCPFCDQMTKFQNVAGKALSQSSGTDYIHRSELDQFKEKVKVIVEALKFQRTAHFALVCKDPNMDEICKTADSLMTKALTLAAELGLSDAPQG